MSRTKLVLKKLVFIFLTKLNVTGFLLWHIYKYKMALFSLCWFLIRLHSESVDYQKQQEGNDKIISLSNVRRHLWFLCNNGCDGYYQESFMQYWAWPKKTVCMKLCMKQQTEEKKAHKEASMSASGNRQYATPRRENTHRLWLN